jgi:hypothetical protein
MKKKIVALALFAVFALSGAAHAHASDLPHPGILPNSPFYFVKSFFEGVGTFFTFGDRARAERYLELAELRLSEAKALAEQGDEGVSAAIARYEERYARAKERAQRVGELDLETRVADAATKHLSVLDEVLERVPTEAREAIQAARERSITRQIEALRGIAMRDAEVAADVVARAAEGRLRAVEARAGRGGEDGVAGVERGLAELERYYSALDPAERGTAGATSEGIELLSYSFGLAQDATAHHVEVLNAVLGRVPPEAQDSIERAIANRDNPWHRSAVPAAPEPQQTQPGGGMPGQTPGGQPLPIPAQPTVPQSRVPGIEPSAPDEPQAQEPVRPAAPEGSREPATETGAGTPSPQEPTTREAPRSDFLKMPSY